MSAPEDSPAPAHGEGADDASADDETLSDAAFGADELVDNELAGNALAGDALAGDATTNDALTPDAPAAAPSDELPAGTRLGPYVIEGTIGAGGMATVYLARDEARGGALVAVKALHRKLAAVPTYVERFAQEARAAAALRHRHVVELFDVRSDAELPYLVMEYLPGETLADRLARARRLPVEKIAEVMLPVVSAVAAAHAAGIVHRDLKPDNIILARGEGGERPVLLDFGISKMLEGPKSRLTQVGQVVGTPYYMSPEQIRSEELDARTDVYSLGVILYECATGKRPFVTDQSVFVLMAEILLGQPTPPSKVERSIPAPLEAVISRAMAPARHDRYPAADALGRALLPFASDEVRALWAPAFGADPDQIEPVVVAPLSDEAPTERPSVGPWPLPRPAIDSGLMTQPAAPSPLRAGTALQPDDLRAFAGLSELSDAELAAFCMAATARTLAKDAVLFAQGTTGDACFAVVRGAVEVSKTLDGTGMVLDVLRAGTFLGQDALIDKATRSVTARAVEDTVVVELHREELHRLLGFHDRVALRLLELIAVTGIRQLRGGTRKLANLLEARGFTAESAEVTATRPLEQLRAAVREWSVRIDEH